MQASVPWGDKHRYDLIIDDKGKLSRVQCKTARLKDGLLIFKTSSQGYDSVKKKRVNRLYLGEVEYFGIYSYDLDKCYLIPIEILGNISQCILHTDRKKRYNQGALFADDFLF